MNLIPMPKKVEARSGIVTKRAIQKYNGDIDYRVKRLLEELPTDDGGLTLSFNVGDSKSESYKLELGQDEVKITANGPKGAFYAVETLRQLLFEDELPCLVIEDEPDFKYRGFYHDVTRGKVPKLETLKRLVDTLAYYKLNSLQLYVEHTYEFKECAPLLERCGYLTASELRELDEYCRERFIDFIPSISTFGHMYEILELDEYKKLRAISDFTPSSNEWLERMRHHTINPLKSESFDLVSSLIDQYAENFTSEYFNICGDETFDLKDFAEKSSGKLDEGELYIDFIKKIISHVSSKGKKIMMWGDILLHHPERIDDLPADTLFLNWDYAKEPNEENVKVFAKSGRQQIVCPGTSTWNKLSENISVSEGNITKMAEYGFKHGAVGLLNTNWGDWGNPCPLELALYGLVLGAEKSWSAESVIDNEYYKRASMVIYGDASGVELIKRVGDMYCDGTWSGLLMAYCSLRAGEEFTPVKVSPSELTRVQNEYVSLTEIIGTSGIRAEIKEEMLLAVEGMCLITELLASLSDKNVKRLTNAYRYTEKFSEAWLKKNKKSELSRLCDLFEYVENL